MKAYSIDLRRKIVDAIERGMLKAQAARTFGAGISTVKRYVTKAQRGEPLEPGKAPANHPRSTSESRSYEDFPSEEITLFKYTDGSTGDAGKGDKFRAIILEDVKGKTVTIGIGSPTTEFDEFLAKSQKVLDTVKWTGS
jgi:Transposase